MDNGRSAQRAPASDGAQPAIAGGAEADAGGGPQARRRRRSQAEWSALVRDFEASGQTLTDFAARHDLGVESVRRWVQRLGKGRAGKRSRPPRRRFTPDERREAVEAYLKSGRSVPDFSRLWGCSPSSLTKWVARWRSEGPQGLEPRPRERKTTTPHPARLPEAVRDEVEATRRAHPDFGLRRVAAFLRRFRGLEVSPSTVRNVLAERGVPTLPASPRRSRPRRTPPRRFERARPGELWQSDITSFVLRRHGRRVYLTVFLDDHSRFIVAWALATHQRATLVIEPLLEGIARFGKPKEVLTDQGRQYFAWRGKSAFQKLLAKEGIGHVVSRAHHPETLGKCERLWQTVGRELWDRVNPDDLDEARARMGHFLAHYNFFRPHQGIGGAVPADRFFGADEARRRVESKAIEENALRLALGDAPRKPVYLFGQIGTESVALSGERGRLVVQTPDGQRRELALDALGAPAREDENDSTSPPDEATPDERPDPESSRRVHGSADDSGIVGASNDPATPPHAPQAHALQDPAASSASREGPVGERHPRGTRARTQDLHGHPGVLDGEEDQGPGGRATRRPAAAGLAALAASALGDAGGALEAAQAPQGRAVGGSSGGEPARTEEACGGAGADAGADRGPGAGLADGAVGAGGVRLEAQEEDPCRQDASEAGEGASRRRCADGSEGSSEAGRTRGRSWRRWLKRRR